MATLSTDLVDLLVDADGDIVFDNGDLPFASGIDGVVQDIKFRLQMIRGEWEFDLDEGIPWFENDSVDEREAIIGSKFDQRRVEAELRKGIVGSDDVVSILSFTVKFDRKERRLSCSFQVRTTFGDSDLEEVNL